MRRLVMVMTRLDGELVAEKFEAEWLRQVLAMEWGESEEKSTERVEGHWFIRWSEEAGCYKSGFVGSAT